MVSGSTGSRASVVEWLREHKALVWVLVLGTITTAWIVPYHRVTARAECRGLYAKAQTREDTLRVDKSTVRRWDRFPGLTFRCEVFRRELRDRRG
jgi:hypothetical protein